MQSKRSGKSALRAVFASAGLFFSMALLAAPAFGQSLAGRWTADGRTLDNGEQEKSILELKQNGNELTGTLKTLGFQVDVKGTATGSHFELFVSEWDPKRPVLVGDLVNGELHALQGGRRPIVARPAGPGDEISEVKYIEPPPLHNVPYNGLAKTPPMGWNSWNLFQGRIDDQTVRTMADAMVSSGMRDAGYIYLNIDDTWEGVRDAQGNLATNHKFPDMKALADYVHSKGLKLGIYSSTGAAHLRRLSGQLRPRGAGCEDLRGLGHRLSEVRLVQRGPGLQERASCQPVYQKMGDALQATGRPIVYSLCEYGLGGVEKWGPRGGRQPLAHHRRHPRLVGEHDRQHRKAGAHGAVRRPRPLERSRHAGDRQRAHERR